MIDGHQAELTFSILSPGMRIADHTGIPDAFRASGVGAALVADLGAVARGWVEDRPTVPFRECPARAPSRMGRRFQPFKG